MVNASHDTKVGFFSRYALSVPPTLPDLWDAAMSSHPKRVIGEEDLLRQVPDDILCQILSLLPSKEAARTCVLSKRWRHIFLRVPKLIAMGRTNGLFTRDPEVNQEMIRFINRWILSSEEAPVDEFRLKATYFPEPSVFYLWLTTLLLRRIKVLELGFTGPPTTLLFPPAEFFRSETLVVLSIAGYDFVLNIPDSVCYSSLKTLHLEELFAVDSSGHFRFTDAGFPRLEELCLKCVHFRSAATEEYVELFEDESILTISLATLKKLVVYHDTHMIDRVDIDTQHLEQLQLTVETVLDMKGWKVNFSKCESLVFADIYQFNPGESYFKLLSEINNVKMLQLSDHSPEDYIGVAVPFPQFIQLTHLKLRETEHQSVWNLLHHAPNLEVLDFVMSYRYEDYLPPEVVPQCLSQSLKEIRITDYKWYEDYSDDEDIEDDDEVSGHAKIVEYFLQHGGVLERMSLGHSKIRTAEWRESTLNLFRNLDRLSQNCEIALQEE